MKRMKRTLLLLLLPAFWMLFPSATGIRAGSNDLGPGFGNNDVSKFNPSGSLLLPVASSFTYLVNSNADAPDANPGDGICDTGSWGGSYCTLRAALEEANADGGASLIQFAQPFVGLQAFSSCNLPQITAPNTTLDASSQWDTGNDRPGVEIINNVCLPLLTLAADNNAVYGILFGGSGNIGIQLNSANNNQIGGSGAGQRNVFIGGTGVKLFSSSNNQVAHNYFGTIDGMFATNSSYGIWLEGSANTIEDNLIVGHSNLGILVNAGQNNTLRNNIVGLNKLQNAALPNALGIGVYADLNTIGPGNVAAGNTGYGLEIKNADDNTVTGNTLGSLPTNNIGNGSDGLHLHNAHRTQVLNNAIAHNSSNGLWSNSQSGLIQNNGFSDNSLDGLYLSGGANQVGGGGQGNGLGGNGQSGIHLDGSQATGNFIRGNFIGLSGGLSDHGNQCYGVLIENGANQNTVGGVAAEDRNWIGFNDWSGIYISGASTYGNVVAGNVVGAALNFAWDAPNGHHGIALYSGAHDNWIGGVGAGNVILANQWSGLAISGSHNNSVAYNYIGTDGANRHWGNVYYGAHLVNGAGNGFYFNEIAYNGSTVNGPGVLIDGSGATGNTVRGNSIHNNGGVGIDLVNGGNTGLASPVIGSASCQGPVQGTACPNCTVEIFSDLAEEGRYFEDTVTADVTGLFVWNGTPAGPHVTATSTDPSGNTSSFSAAVDIGVCFRYNVFLPLLLR